MARLTRLAVPGECHLVLQRGHNGARVFTDEADRRAYLDALAQASAQHGLRIYGYGLADTQALLLAEPAAPDSLSRAMQALGRRYVAAFNRRHGRQGTLWDGRFRAGVVQAPRHFLDALLYVEAAGGGGADDATRSSLPHHLGRRRVGLVSDHSAFWAIGNTPFDREIAYRARAEQGVAAALGRALAEAAAHGWAVGDAAFVARVAAAAQRPAAPRARGRPPASR
jgi:putative transposase